VMVNGQVLESGAPSQIRESVEVRRAYLGEDAIPANRTHASQAGQVP